MFGKKTTNYLSFWFEADWVIFLSFLKLSLDNLMHSATWHFPTSQSNTNDTNEKSVFLNDRFVKYIMNFNDYGGKIKFTCFFLKTDKYRKLVASQTIEMNAA